MHVCFPFDHQFYSALIISSQKKAPTSHVCNFRNHIPTFKDGGACKYLQTCSHLIKSIKKLPLFMQCQCKQNFFEFRIMP